jgi:hypothetical protein
LSETPSDAAQRLRLYADVRGDVVLRDALDEVRKSIDKIPVPDGRFVAVERGELLDRIEEYLFGDQPAEPLALGNVSVQLL